MQITNAQILASVEPIRILSGYKLPIKVAYTLGRVLKKIEKEAAYIEKLKQTILEKYAKRDTDNNMVLVPLSKEQIESGVQRQVVLEDPASWSKEINELLAIEIIIDARPITLDSFGQEFTIQSDVLSHLDWLIVENPSN